MSTPAPKPGPPPSGRTVVQLPIGDVHPHRNNVRSNARQGVEELAESIRSVGVLQPLLVQRQNGRFTIVDGHRRYYAAKRAGVRTVPCLTAAAADYRTQVELMLASAMSARLEPLDMARAFGTLRDDLALSVADIAGRTGYSQATVRDRLAILDLPGDAQRMLANKEISATDAVQLARQASRARRDRKDSRYDGTVPGHRRQGWFTGQHPLAATVKAACTHRSERTMVGGIGCGQCWEHAITAAATPECLVSGDLRRARVRDRSPKPCRHPRANHEHGTYLAYDKDRCRCEPCTAANARHGKLERYRTATGTARRVDAEPAREHVLTLLQSLTVGQIERRSGVNRTSIQALLGRHPGVPITQRLAHSTAVRLLAVRPTRLGPEQGGLVDAAGTIRRLQALAVIGWDQKAIAARITASSATLWKLLNTPPATVTVSLRDRVRSLYDAESMRPRPPSRAASRARAKALACGWAAPLEWDDDEIDDPAATPHRPNVSRGRFDVDDVELLIQEGCTAAQIAGRLGCSRAAVQTRLARAGRRDLLDRLIRNLAA